MSAYYFFRQPAIISQKPMNQLSPTTTARPSPVAAGILPAVEPALPTRRCLLTPSHQLPSGPHAAFSFIGCWAWWPSARTVGCWMFFSGLLREGVKKGSRRGQSIVMCYSVHVSSPTLAVALTSAAHKQILAIFHSPSSLRPPPLRSSPVSALIPFPFVSIRG